MNSIIIFGEIGAGKDTAAEILAKHLNSQIVKLGWKIRKDVDEICDKITISDKNRRELYQHYGQGMRKVFGQDLWNMILYDKIKEGLNKGMSYIIADGRQTNEFTFWIDIGFIPVAVVADKDVRMKRVKKRDGFDQSNTLNHETEINARKITKHIKESEPTGRAFTIVNNGTIKELEEQINQVINKIVTCHLVGS